MQIKKTKKALFNIVTREGKEVSTYNVLKKTYGNRILSIEYTLGCTSQIALRLMCEDLAAERRYIATLTGFNPGVQSLSDEIK